MFEVAITDVSREGMGFACGVIARGMRDNPIHKAAFSDDPLVRMRGRDKICDVEIKSLK